jgi:hypothetical protein
MSMKYENDKTYLIIHPYWLTDIVFKVIFTFITSMYELLSNYTSINPTACNDWPFRILESQFGTPTCKVQLQNYSFLRPEQLKKKMFLMFFTLWALSLGVS